MRASALRADVGRLSRLITVPYRAPNSPIMESSALFIVSPHYDDAAFSCGMLLAAHPGSTVVTVFGGAPAVPMSTSWDRSSGFLHSDEAIRARRLEDRRALALLDACGLHLEFFDAQYEDATPQSVEAMPNALVEAWKCCGCPPVIAPLGLYHSDHVIVSDVCCAIFSRGDIPELVLYEDALYRRIRHMSRERRETLAQRGFRLDPEADGRLLGTRHSPRAATQKWHSVRAYRSQLRALGDSHPSDLVEPERYWRLSVDRAAHR
jgi:LmbE family N-acetylglucosaminyl deacetylase